MAMRCMVFTISLVGSGLDERALGSFDRVICDGGAANPAAHNLV